MFKKLIIIIGFFFSISLSFSWSYPVKEISKPVWKCKFELWKNLSPDCKTKLPALKTSDYKTKSKSLYYRAIFSVLWASSYKYWWDMMWWTHLWVDIASSSWTPVYTIWDWKVVFVWTQSWRWKTVVVRHSFKWKYIFSNYAHLSRIVVVNWQNIKEWDKIWEIWNTWNSFGNHLHFQIDKNQDSWNHPFWFRRCNTRKSIKSIVNSTECLKEVIQNTIDPIEFLETNWANIDFSTDTVKKIRKKKIDRTWMISNKEIERKIIKDFLKTYKFSFNFNKLWVYNIWDYWHFNISLKDRAWRTLEDILPKELEIIYDTSFFSSVYPKTLRIVDERRKVSFRAKKTWVTFFTIKMWENTIYQKMIRIVSPRNPIKVAHWRLMSTNSKKYIWMSNWWIAVFQDAWHLNIIKAPFAWNYRLSASNWLKLCKWPKSIQDIKNFDCEPQEFKDSFKFNYYDTLYWIFLFKFSWSLKKNAEIILRDSSWNIITRMKVQLHDVKLTNPDSPYSLDVRKSCRIWLCTWILDRWFVRTDRSVNRSEMKYILRNFLNLLWKQVRVNVSAEDLSKNLSRKEFIKYLFRVANLKIKDYSKTSTKYLDISGIPKDSQNQVKYLERLWFLRKDRFWKSYFQANKQITIAEALYLVNFLISKYR